MIYQKNKTIAACLSMMLLSITTAGLASAWGPERDTYTMATPATHAVFNSITDNDDLPSEVTYDENGDAINVYSIGDERNFVRIGEIVHDGTTRLLDTVEIKPGKDYLVYIYYHNDADPIYNNPANNPDNSRDGIALNTRMSSSFTKWLTPGVDGEIKATISYTYGNITDPLKVWDEAKITTKSEKVALEYVPGTAKLRNAGPTNGTVLPDSFVSEIDNKTYGLFTENGTGFGYFVDSNNNYNVPGCVEYHGVVTYVLRATELSGSVEKTVSKDGENFAEDTSIYAGDTVTFKLVVKNTGDRKLTNAVLLDQLPEGLSLKSGSVKLTINDVPNTEIITDDLTNTRRGISLGEIGTGQTIIITYEATAGADFDCKGKTVENLVKFVYDSNLATGDLKTDKASVNIKKNPEEEECKELPDTGSTTNNTNNILVAIASGAVFGGFLFVVARRSVRK